MAWHCASDAICQTTNPCGVVASFTPGNDSVVSQNNWLTFQSTSVNATSLKWYIDNSPTFNTTDALNYSFSTGSHEVMLVASNGACSDTAIATYFSPGTPHRVDSLMLSSYGFYQTNEYGTQIDDTPDGGFILGGESVNWSNKPRGYLVKIKQGGCIEWSRMIDNPFSGEITMVKGCADSSILASTLYYGKGNFLTRFDKNGNMLWQKAYMVGGYGHVFHDLVEDADGNLYALTGSGALSGIVILKLDRYGNLIWNKYYDFSWDQYETNNAISLVLQNGQLFVSGIAYFGDPYNGFKGTNFLLKLRADDGQTVFSKQFISQNGSATFRRMSTYGSQIMVSAIGLSGPKLGHAVAIIDENGDFQKGVQVTHHNNVTNNLMRYFDDLHGYAESDNQQNIYLLNFANQPLTLQPGFARYSYALKLDASFQLKWGALYNNYYRGQFIHGALNKEKEWAVIGTDHSFVENGTYMSRNFRVMKIKEMPITTTDMNCDFKYDGFDLEPVYFQGKNLQLFSDSSLQLAIEEPNYQFSTVYSESRFHCPDFIDSCTMFNVTGPSKFCRLNDVYTYKVAKNNKCALPVQWEVSSGATILSKTDSEIQVRFSSYGNYTVSAALLSSCNPKKDSIQVWVNGSTPQLNLGVDTSICAGNQLVLHAGPSYFQYQWQDGSTDSLKTVTNAGTYWVEVIDSCGNIMRDSIVVSITDKLWVDAGPDRTKCNHDTLHLTAPDGYLNYTWSNEYHISSLTSQTVVVDPLIDTAYYLKAEKTPGCFAFDTVRVKVWHSPKINLGPDRSFCDGEGVTFNAGTGFMNYTWSDGSTGQTLAAKAPGTYRVTATTMEGCKSFDTVKVLQVYPLPVVQLNKDETLCTGDYRTLDAGNFSAYLWQDGSTGRRFEVTSIGQYAVQVTDNNGCKGSDTTVIKKLLPLPQAFLSSDTAICSYGTVELKPLPNIYRNYLWSNGAVTPSITVTQPGNYWLQVWDVNNCMGKDTVIVSPKECMDGMYIPSAFSPNGDGRNDLFRPLLFGNVKHFQFKVYNRWGEIIFQTSEMQKGWDGKVKGLLQETGVYVWTCTYQMEGESRKQKKGSVMLIK